MHSFSVTNYKLGQYYKIVPSIHCLSAIWVFENIYCVNNRITMCLEFRV
jgi:hypothetical protein